MIDLHSHILPNMDDGSKSPEESAQLLTLLEQQGATAVAATPHFYASRETPEDFLRRREQAAAMLPDTDMPLLLGAEAAYFSGISSCRELADLQLGDTGLILVEMPFTPWTERIIRDICDIPIRLGLIPVLAHVDRYRQRSQFSKYCRLLKSSDVLFQCNADVFASFSGQLWALRQLKQDNIHFLGSDCHNLTTRAPKLQLAADTITKKLGAAVLARLNAQAEQLVFPDTLQF